MTLLTLLSSKSNSDLYLSDIWQSNDSYLHIVTWTSTPIPNMTIRLRPITSFQGAHRKDRFSAAAAFLGGIFFLMSRRVATVNVRRLEEVDKDVQCDMTGKVLVGSIRKC